MSDPLAEARLLTEIKTTAKELSTAQQIYDNAKQALNVAKQIQSEFQGNYGWSRANFKDYASYGAGNDINSLLTLAEKGGGAGGVGGIGSSIQTLAKQFPMNTHVINQAISDPQTQKYYAMQSETILATRAASQTDYNNIQKQIDYQNQLRNQIDTTKNVKSSIDLLTRSQIEGNLINLAILRESTLSNQQQSLHAQAEMNDAVFNANFLNP